MNTLSLLPPRSSPIPSKECLEFYRKFYFPLSAFLSSPGVDKTDIYSPHRDSSPHPYFYTSSLAAIISHPFGSLPTGWRTVLAKKRDPQTFCRQFADIRPRPYARPTVSLISWGACWRRVTMLVDSREPWAKTPLWTLPCRLGGGAAWAAQLGGLSPPA